MMKLSLSEIKNKVDDLAVRIGASADLLPTYGYSIDFAYPHIEVDARGYHYVVMERGEELLRKTTQAIDELLFYIFSHVTFDLSVRYELAHRNAAQDGRRIMFRHQVELLAVLSTNWAEKELQEHESILQQYPYDDDVNLRLAFSMNLIEQGHTPDAAWKLACEKFPMPQARK